MTDNYHEERSEYLMNAFITLVIKNTPSRKETVELVKFMYEIMTLYPHVNGCVYRRFDEWVMELLFYPVEAVRLYAEVMIMNLLPKIRGYMVAKDIVPLTVNYEGSELDDISREHLQDLIRHYWNLMDFACGLEKISFMDKTEINADEQYPPSQFLLFSYVRLFQWLLISEKEIAIALENNNVTRFLKLFEKIDTQNHDCDMNKYEMFKLWHKLTNVPEVTDEFAKSKYSQNRIFDCYIKLNHVSKPLVSYNNETLHYFYEIYLRCAQINEEFKYLMCSNQNFSWAIKYMLIMSPVYPAPAVFLRELFIMALELSADFKTQWVAQMIEFVSRNRYENWSRVFQCLTLVLRDTPEQIEFYSRDGLSRLLEVWSDSRNNHTNEEWSALLEATLKALEWLKESDLPNEYVHRKASIHKPLLKKLLHKVHECSTHYITDDLDKVQAIVEILENLIKS